ncbi:hypothetical protein AVEN_48827-1 [Araneus ventricosus]|uniref:Integrase catalytic domain-containing protein n=1 Tax=Araneus ventricosus TaxID=182803 RepID=A0A4Y2AG55_ARAVE|nr:hypothetical protein AVEN_48827-1 [Araneus ventricosus]
MPSTLVAKPALSGQVEKVDPIDSIDPLRSKVNKCVLWIVDQHTRWDEATPLTSLKDKVTCEVSLSSISKTGKTNIITSDNKTNFKTNLTKKGSGGCKTNEICFGSKTRKNHSVSQIGIIQQSLGSRYCCTNYVKRHFII